MKRLFLLAILSILLAAGGANPRAQAPEARLLRFPAIHGNQIVFTYAGDLYTVPATGGLARRLTSDVGFEMFARFSPDGKQIAFTGQYDGNTEVYVMPSEGGMPKRLTWTATLGRDDVSDRMGPNNLVMGWKDATHVLFRSRRINWNDFLGKLYLADVNGGPLEELPFPYGGFGSFSADGSQTRLQPRLPRVPHLEALPRRHGRRPLAVRLRLEKDDGPDEQPGAGHHPDVEGQHDLLRLGSRRALPHEPVQLRPRRRSRRRSSPTSPTSTSSSPRSATTPSCSRTAATSTGSTSRPRRRRRCRSPSPRISTARGRPWST